MPGWLQRCGRALLLLTLAVQLPPGSAHAIVAMPQAIDRPIPAEWRPPLARFLHELGAADIETILDGTTGGPIGGTLSDAVLVRFEDRALCARDVCLTVIGIIRTDGFFPQAMFTAGKFFARSDSMGQLLGRLVPAPVWLCTSERPGDRDCLTLQETGKGWIVSPGTR